MNQTRLNKDIAAYCDIAWGLKEMRERKTYYRDIEMLSPSQIPNGDNPITMADFASFKMVKDKVVEIVKDKVVEVEVVKQPHWLVTLYRTVIGWFK